MAYYPSDLFYNIASLSGCAWHYVADDLDVANNTNLGVNPVTWVNRGSVSSGISTLTPFGTNGPILKKLGIYGHNTVQFLAGSGTFQSVVSSGAEPQYTQITQLALFKHTTAPTGLAMFFGLVDKTGANKRINFSMQFTNPSGWNFTALDSVITLDSRTVNNCIYLDDWMIRADVAKVSYFSMRRNGTEIDQFNAFLPLPTSSNGYFTIGGEAGTAIHNVEVAEVVVFSRILPTGDIQAVENFWKRQYFIGGGGGCDLFINSTSSSGHYKTLPLFIGGGNYFSCTLYVGGFSSVSSGTTLYLGSALAKSSGVPLYMYGRDVIPPTDHPELGGLPLYVKGLQLPNYSGAIPLIVWGATALGSGVGGGGALTITENTRRSVLGIGFSSNIMFPLPNNSIADVEADGSDLKHVGGMYRGLGSGTGGIGAPTSNFGLYSYSTLYIAGGVSAGPFPLFIKADPTGNNTGALPLFLKANETSGVYNLTTTLFVQNNTLQSTKSTKLFIRGLGSLDGGLTQDGSMPLYIERWPAGATTLFINSSVTPSSIPLYISSANSLTKAGTLYMSGGPPITSASSISLFAAAGQVFPSSISLYVKGLPTMTGNSTLYTSGF